MSSFFLSHKGLLLFTLSYSWLISLIFFFFFSFLLFSSSTFGSSVSFSFSFSSSSSETSFSVDFSTQSSIGKEINSECFLMRSFNFLSSKNSIYSSFNYKMILVPLPILFDPSSRMMSLVMEKVELATDSHLYCSPSSLFLEMTITLLATR